MEGEINNFILVWTSIIVSICYCYRVAKVVPKGTTRFIAILPVVCLFLFLPLNLKSIHLGCTTAFFIAWLANFKLLLFSFGLGPLSSPTIPLPHFIVLACLPIKAQENTQYYKDPNAKTEQNPSHHASTSARKYTWSYKKQVLFLAFLVFLDANCKEYIPKKIMQVLYCIYIYIGLEIILGVAGKLARAWLGLELEPPFNDPYLSSSFQDFWGRRWNNMASTILRLSVYNPVLHYSTRVLGRNWASIPAVLCSFLISGLMHELIIYYMGRVKPVWGFMRFFLIQSVCLIIEGGLKKKITDAPRLPRAVTGPIIFGFIIIMFIWLVMPQLEALNAVASGVEEYAAVGRFFMYLTGL